MKREKYPTRKIRLVGELQRNHAIVLLHSLPIDDKKPLEIVIREEVKPRRVDQNSLMWSCQLKCIAEQAYVNGRTYSAEVWHEHFKELFLPEFFDSPEHEAEFVKPGYKKRDCTPGGAILLVGSTTELTIKGFAIYLQQVEAFGAQLGVIYSANPNEAYT